MPYKDIKKRKEYHLNYNRIWMRGYYLRNKKKILEASEEYRLANPEKFKKYQAKYRNNNLNKVREASRKWAMENKEKGIQWAKNNKEKINKAKKQYYYSHPNVIIASALRTRVLSAFRSQNAVKSKKTLELVGCSIEYLKKHLENQFTPGMNWNNRGFYGWHIDHIKPLSLFDLKDTNQQKIAFHYSNLQPLWAKDNLAKKNKYNG